MSDRALDPNWDTFIYVAAEGFRIALISCLRCGATVTLSEGPPDTSEIHNRWHESLAAPTTPGATE